MQTLNNFLKPKDADPTAAAATVRSVVTVQSSDEGETDNVSDGEHVDVEKGVAAAAAAGVGLGDGGSPRRSPTILRTPDVSLLKGSGVVCTYLFLGTRSPNLDLCR